MTSTRRKWPDVAPRIAEIVDGKFPVRRRLCEAIGVHESTLALWLNGKRTPELESFFRLASALDLRVGDEFDRAPSQSPSFEVDPSLAAVVPVVAKEVAAGEARIPLIDEIGPEEAYFFREDWLRQRHGWNGRMDRFFCIRLAKTSNAAGSMEPTIWADSIVLCDRHPAIARGELRDRSIWLVNDGTGLAVKRVTRQDGALLLESDAVGRRYAPKILPMKGRDISHVLPGKVIWWGTNAVYAEER